MNSIVNKIKILALIAFYTSLIATSGCASKKNDPEREGERETPKIPLAGLFVDVNSSATSPDGSSWAQAFPDIKQAIEAVGTSGKKIYVAAGTYKGDANKLDLSAKSDIHLVGGCKGGEQFEKDLSKLTTDDMTTLDAQGGNNLVLIQNGAKNISYRGFVFKGVRNGHAIQIIGRAGNLVEGITITNSKFIDNQDLRPTNGLDGFGSAMLIAMVKKIELSHIDFVGNQSSQFGGAVVIAFPQDASFKHLRFENNQSGMGGALGIMTGKNPGEITVADLEFIDNKATKANAGGAITIGLDGNDFTAIQGKSPSLIFAGPITHSGNTAATSGGNSNGSFLRIEIETLALPSIDDLKSFIDVGNSGIELETSPLVHIKQP